jgi:hypothetical protein
MYVVLVCAGLCNKIPQTEWLTNNTDLFSVLEAGTSEIKVPADVVSGDVLLPASYTAIFLLQPHMWKGVRNTLEDSLQGY